MSHIVVVGDALLDVDVDGVVERVCPDAPVPVVDLATERARPGGAALAAAIASGGGDAVTLVTGIGDDEAGERLRGLLAAVGVAVVDLGLRAPTPVKERIRAAGQVLVRLDRGSPTDATHLGAVDGAGAVLDGADAVVVADYGRGVADVERLRAAIEASATVRPLVWDPHPRSRGPVPGAWLATPNHVEADQLAGAAGAGTTRLARAASAADILVGRWLARGVAVTCGAHGAVLATGAGPPLVLGSGAIRVDGDTCGAGDRFATAAAAALAEGAVISEAVDAAARTATAFVARGAASAVATGSAGEAETDGPPAGSAALEVVDRVRRRGGTVVATGGCFDLLHAGHIELLARARSLGDCLIVLVNSDRSVRRLKGAGRPIVPVADRIRVLEALEAVDAVAIFDEDTPVAALERVRPDVFVKGGDYAAMALPEQDVLARWGGVAVTIPYVGGRSTSRIVEEVLRVP